TTVKINGSAVESDNFVVDGKTYVWIRDVATIFGKQIEWDAQTNTADIVDELTKTVATVNGQIITNKDVKIASMINSNNNPTEEDLKNALNYEIENAVLLGEAAKNGFSIDDDIKAAAAKEIATFKEYYGENAASILASYNLTEEKYQTIIEKSFVIKNLYDFLKAENPFTQTQLEQKYKEMSDAFITATAKHILISNQDKTEAETTDLLNKIKKELKTPEMFNEVMSKYSEDTGTKDDPDGMTFGKGQMVPEFEAAAFSQEVGVIGEPLKTQYGYHIILVTDRTTKPFEEVKSICEDELFKTWLNDKLKVWMDASEITIF
ncbi:MAG: hypothetical protein GX800_04525, partial [Clostridiaceae bacterium]|nr:hypothetical protein [Clostridiaceae bacterium]